MKKFAAPLLAIALAIFCVAFTNAKASKAKFTSYYWFTVSNDNSSFTETVVPNSESATPPSQCSGTIHYCASGLSSSQVTVIDGGTNVQINSGVTPGQGQPAKKAN